MTRIADVLRALAESGVEFILIGGVAAAAYGVPSISQVLDILYSRDRQNLQRLVDTLAPYRPQLRGAPAGLPFRFDIETLRAGLNFTLTTDLGWIDLLGEIVVGGGYQDLLPRSIPLPVFGISCHVLDLETLIRTKRAAGRPKDYEGLAELDVLRDRLNR